MRGNLLLSNGYVYAYCTASIYLPFDELLHTQTSKLLFQPVPLYQIALEFFIFFSIGLLEQPNERIDIKRKGIKEIKCLKIN